MIEFATAMLVATPINSCTRGLELAGHCWCYFYRRNKLTIINEVLQASSVEQIGNFECQFMLSRMCILNSSAVHRMAILNLILKPLTSFVLYRIYQDRTGETLFPTISIGGEWYSILDIAGNNSYCSRYVLLFDWFSINFLSSFYRLHILCVYHMVIIYVYCMQLLGCRSYITCLFKFQITLASFIWPFSEKVIPHSADVPLSIKRTNRARYN